MRPVASRTLRWPHLVVGLGLSIPVFGCGSSAADDLPIVEVDEGQVKAYPADVDFADVRDVVTDGVHLWVLDRAAPFITRLSLDGDRAHRFAWSGEGPDELTKPVALWVAGEHVDVVDLEMGKRASFSWDGTLASVHRLSDERSGWIRGDMERVSHIDPWRVRALGSDTYYVRLPDGMTQPVDFAGGELVRATPDLQPRRAVARFADYLPRDERGTGQFPATPLWDVCDDRMALWNPRKERVEWVSENGLLLHSIRVQAEGVPVTDAGVLGFLRGMAAHELGPGVEVPAAALRTRLRDVRPLFGQLATDFVDLRCSPDGTVWLRRFDLEADPLGADDEWLRVPASGDMSRVRFPTRFEPFVFKDNEVVGVVETPLGDRLGAWRATPFL